MQFYYLLFQTLFKSRIGVFFRLLVHPTCIDYWRSNCCKRRTRGIDYLLCSPISTIAARFTFYTNILISTSSLNCSTSTFSPPYMHSSSLSTASTIYT